MSDTVRSRGRHPEPDVAAAVQQRITEAIAAGEPRLLLDMGAAELGGTATLSSFCCALRHLADAGARITVTGLAPNVRRVLELCEIEGLEL